MFQKFAASCQALDSGGTSCTQQKELTQTRTYIKSQGGKLDSSWLTAATSWDSTQEDPRLRSLRA